MDTNLQRTRDAWLTLRCQTGEIDAFRELVDEMERPLLYFTTKLLGEETPAFDVLQQVWLRVFKTIRKLQQPEQLRSWLYQMTRGLAVDHLRKQASVERLERHYADQNPETGDEPTFNTDDAAALHRALDRLDFPLREVLVLHFLEELSIAEVAGVVGCPEGTVKSRLYHAKRQLRQLLQEADHA